MTKAEYFTNLYCCYIKCDPSKSNCDKCQFFEWYKNKYRTENIEEI